MDTCIFFLFWRFIEDLQPHMISNFARGHREYVKMVTVKFHRGKFDYSKSLSIKFLSVNFAIGKFYQRNSTTFKGNKSTKKWQRKDKLKKI